MIWLQNALAFLVTLGILVTIHEYGHYIVARWCGVKVLRFSLGMGKVIYSKRLGKDQTEWAISLLPLGGYVKMLDAREQGADSIKPEELPREFGQQSVWKRIAIVAAGPVANFLLAIALYTGLYVHGVKEPLAKIRVGSDTSLAYQAGLRHGDIVISVNGESVQGFNSLRWKLMQLEPSQPNPVLGIKRAKKDKPDQFEQHSIELPLNQLNSREMQENFFAILGVGQFSNSKPVIKGFKSDSPALKAGLQVGDRVDEVNGRALLDAIDFIQMVNANPDKPLKLTVQRGQERLELMVTPISVALKSQNSGPLEALLRWLNLTSSAAKVQQIGKLNVELSAFEQDMVLIKAGPLDSFVMAAEKTWDTSIFSLKMMGKMVTGSVSLKNITGPLTIADYAGQTSRTSAITYIAFIAVISISLGVMNLLPIPVLDGGHLLYYSLEVLTGKPLQDRYVEMGQRAGVFLLLTMMAIAFFNDIARLVS